MGFSHLRQLWKEVGLPATVGLSLVIHFLLGGITLSRRWRFRSPILKGSVWLWYSLANVVVMYALGMISNELGETSENSDTQKILKKRHRLIAFWAPMLMLLLGGPDSMTAYSLEDNELWKRQILQVLGQAIGTFIIILIAWSNSCLSYLSAVMLVAACVKCGEKTYVLWMASSEKLQESMQSPNPGPNYPKFAKEYRMREKEGYHLGLHKESEVYEPVDPSIGETYVDIVRAKALFPRFRRLFSDLILSDRDKFESRKIFGSIQSSEEAFRVVDIELHFMYEQLHTKARLLYSWWGVVIRLLVISLITSVMGCFITHFFFIKRSKRRLQYYTRVDVTVALVLLASLLVQEVYAIVRILDTYEANDWCHRGDKISEGIKCIIPGLNPRRSKQPRCSNYMGQFCLLDFVIKSTTNKVCRYVPKKLNIDKAWYSKYVFIPGGLQDSLFSSIKELTIEVENGLKIGDWNKETALAILRKHNIPDETGRLSESMEDEFDQCVLAWHIATEMSYQKAVEKATTPGPVRRSLCKKKEPAAIVFNDISWSILLSRYMVYLMVNFPTMLPKGISRIRIQDTEAEASNFFRGMKSSISARGAFSEVPTVVPPLQLKGSMSKSVLFDGRNLESVLLVDEGDQALRERKWRMIADFWFHLLVYAAKECAGSTHAKHMREGGELLTQVWMLMGHYGLTDHFQLKQGSVISGIRRT